MVMFKARFLPQPARPQAQQQQQQQQPQAASAPEPRGTEKSTRQGDAPVRPR